MIKMFIEAFTRSFERLACRSALAQRLCVGYYKSMIQKERGLAELGPDDHVLVVGGGPCPISALLIHQHSGARVTVVDCRELCVKKAREYIASLGLSEAVEVLCAYGQDIDMRPYSVVHLALQIEGKEWVAARCFAQAKPGTRILVRMGKEDQGGGSKLCSACARVAHSPCQRVGQTLLYRVQEGEEVYDRMEASI